MAPSFYQNSKAARKINRCATMNKENVQSFMQNNDGNRPCNRLQTDFNSLRKKKEIAYHFLLTIIFWRPGNLNFARRRASWAWWLLLSLQRTERRTCPIATLAQVPCGLPKAPLIPVWSLSAPAHESILLIRRTWKGWTLTLKWKASFPANLAMYLLQAIRAASRASLETFSFSQDTKCTQNGNSSTPFLFIPTS